MTRYKIGIVGFGKIARDQHAPAIAASADFELVAVSNLGAGAAPVGVACFASAADMLNGVKDLDAVALCTPPAPRRSIAVECLGKGKHVLLEKPPAATVAEVSDMAKRADSAGKVLFGTYHAQHNAGVKAAAQALAGKAIKQLLVTWKEDVRKWHPGQDWILAEGGFGVFDPGINALSILTRILPEPLFIHSADLFFPNNRQAPIAASLRFTLADTSSDAFTANLDWRWNGAEVWEIEIETADGLNLKLTGGGAKLDVDGKAPVLGEEKEYPDIYREFAQLIAAHASKADIAPFQLVADAFMLGKRTAVEAFEF